MRAVLVFVLSVFLFAPASLGCSKSLRVTAVDAAHRRPSNVAVYFTVDSSSGEPIPGLVSENFEIYEDGKLVSVHESRQRIVNPEVAAAHYTLLLVDMSGSVSESDQLPVIVEASQRFTEQLEGHQRVAIYAFDGSAKLHPIQPFAQSDRTQKNLPKLEKFRAKDPSTNLHGALVAATKELNEALEKAKEPLRFGTLVVFTDGTDRAARVSREKALETVRGSAMDVFAIGVGSEIDEGTLSDFGVSGYVLAENSGALVNAFDVIGERILAFTQRYYLLSYCSPARAGVHKVTIRAVDPTSEHSGDLSYQFDAKKFGPKCDPERPPPFDTKGKTRRAAVTRAAPENLRLEVDARVELNAAAKVDASAKAEGGDDDVDLDYSDVDYGNLE